MTKIEKEKRTIKFMINLYCEKKHKSSIDECIKCKGLYKYASSRLDKCIFAENKTSCRNCVIHCFSLKRRKQIKEIMRFSGPRIVFYRPFQYISYMIRSNKVKTKETY